LDFFKGVLWVGITLERVMARAKWDGVGTLIKNVL
jgi:hypothetical protein